MSKYYCKYCDFKTIRKNRLDKHIKNCYDKDLKIGICFFGKIGYTEGRCGYGKKLDINITYNHLKKHILENYPNVDIFIHSWDIDDKDNLMNVFKPISIVCEKQKQFGIDISKLSIDEMNDEYNIGAHFRAISQTYSMVSSIDLLKKHEKDKDFRYDNVIILRLDSLFIKNIKLKELNKESITLCCKKKKGIFFDVNYNSDIEGIPHSSFILFLNTILLENTNYDDIYNYDYYKNNNNNVYSNIKKINTFSFLNPILLKNNVIGLKIELVDIIRRVYYEKEKTYMNNNFVFRINSNIKKNWLRYKSYYNK